MSRPDLPGDETSSETRPPDFRVSGLPIKDVFEQMARGEDSVPSIETGETVPETSDDSATKSSLPRRFGDYELIKIIAEGGTGVVWEARQVGVNRRVAIKIMRAARWVGEDAVSRFIAEAEVVSLLEHKHITPIYNVGEIKGVPYLAMPLYTQGSFTDHLDRIGTDLKKVARIVAAIADAVQHAHDRGILHRDLKPSNILLDPADDPHVADFGLGRNLNEASKLTTAGSVLGSLVYLAPETLSAIPPTRAVDVYGLGTILYETLTGRPPYRGDHVAEILTKIGNDSPVHPREIHPALDRDLSTICMKCLARDPADRYATAQAVAIDLRDWLKGRPISARPVHPVERLTKWVRRNPALAALITIAPVGLGLFVALKHGRGQQLAQAQVDVRSSQTELSDLNRRQRFAAVETRLSDDRQREASAGLTALLRDDPADVAAATRLQNIFSRRQFAMPLFRSTMEEQEIIDGFFSADSQHLLLLGLEGGFKVQTLESEDGVWRGTDSLYVDATLDPDGNGFQLVSNIGELSRWSLDDLAAPLRSIPLNAVEESHEWLRPRPDIARLRQHVVAEGRSPFRRGQLFRSANNPAEEMIWRIRSSWGPHGKQITAWPFQSTSFSTYDTDTGEPIARSLMLGAGVMSAAFTSDGAGMWTGDPGGGLTQWDLTTGELIAQVITEDELPLTHLLASPDGRQVAARSLDRKLWIFDTQSEPWRQTPLALPDKVGDFAFNSQGTQLAVSLANGSIQILDTTTFATMMENIISPGLATSLSYSADRDILLAVIENGQIEVWDTTVPTTTSATWGSSSPLLGDSLIDPSGDYAILARESGLVRLDLTDPSAAPHTLLENESRVVRALTINAARTHLVAALADHEVTEIVTWSLPQLRSLFRETREFVALDLAFAADGETLLSYDPRGEFRAITPIDQNSADPIPTQPGANTPRAISADGSHAALLDAAGEINIFDTSTRQILCTIPAPPTPISALQFGDSAEVLYIASQDGNVRRWTWPMNHPEAGPILSHSTAVSVMTTGPRGETFYTGTPTGAITCWQPQAGTSRVFTDVKTQDISHLALTPDGQWLASGSTNGTVQVWHTPSGLPVTSQIDLGSPLENLAWHPRHDRLVAITRDGAVHAPTISLTSSQFSPEQLAIIESAVGLCETEDGSLQTVGNEAFQKIAWERVSAGEAGQTHWWDELARAQSAKREVSGNK